MDEYTTVPITIQLDESSDSYGMTTTAPNGLIEETTRGNLVSAYAYIGDVMRSIHDTFGRCNFSINWKD